MATLGSRRSAKDSFTALIALLAWFALGIQFTLTLLNPQRSPAGLNERIDAFFSYFTILTNLLVAVTLSVLVLGPRSRLGRRAQSPRFLSGLAVWISLVSLGYEMLLRRLWKPEGWGLVADTLFHDIVPLSFVLIWTLWVPKGQLSLRDIPAWMAYPAAYFGYVLVHGELTGRYPYPFMDVAEIGYLQTTINALVLLAVAIVLGGVFVAADRAIARLAAVSRSPKPR